MQDQRTIHLDTVNADAHGGTRDGTAGTMDSTAAAAVAAAVLKSPRPYSLMQACGMFFEDDIRFI